MIRLAICATNPDYKGPYVFDSDFPALMPETATGKSDDAMFLAENVAGTARVICFSERHDLSTDDMVRIDALPEPLNRRARHVVNDNAPTQQGLAALKAGDAVGFGKRMVQSHATERDNYEVTVPETDALATGAVDLGALGS